MNKNIEVVEVVGADVAIVAEFEHIEQMRFVETHFPETLQDMEGQNLEAQLVEVDEEGEDYSTTYWLMPDEQLQNAMIAMGWPEDFVADMVMPDDAKGALEEMVKEFEGKGKPCPVLGFVSSKKRDGKRWPAMAKRDEYGHWIINDRVFKSYDLRERDWM